MPPTATGGSKLLTWVGEALPGEAEPLSGDSYGLPAELFSICLGLSTAFRQLRQDWTPVEKARYLEIHGRLCLWRDNILDGRLELCLTKSPELYRSILDLLCVIGQVFLQATIGKPPFVFDSDEKINVARLSRDLKRLLEDVSAVLESLSAEEPTASSEADTTDSESEAEAQSNADRLDSFLRSLQTRTKLLMDTCPALEQTYFHANKPTKALTTTPPTFCVSEAAQSYVRKVYDRFSAGDMSLIERLGEANWQRHQRLRSDQDLTAEERAREEAITQSLFRPSSKFRDSALGASLPSTSNFAPSITSHSSFASTLTSGSSGKARVPKTPAAVFRGEDFECEICHTIVSGLSNRIDWKMHVFEDLQPYICTSAGCPDILNTFASRKEWSNHEFSKHRSTTSYHCHDCSKDFASRNDCLNHLASVHGMTDLRDTQGLAMVAAATTTVVNPIAKQKCPLCWETDWFSERKFVTHVSRHMEDVALSSLPREIDSDDNSAQSESEGDLAVYIREPRDFKAEQETLPYQGITEPVHGEEIGGGDATSNELDPSSSRFRDTETGRCPHLDCGKFFKDLKAHMLTHQVERPYLCLFQSCDYSQKGFARAYDMNRHLLTHFKGTMICGYCPGSGSATEKSFNRADVFKRHLTSVHGVVQTPPNSRRPKPPATKILSDYGPDATGRCTNCSQIFGDAQDFYEHLDACMVEVIKKILSQDNDAPHLSVLHGDKELQETFDRHLLRIEQPAQSELEEDDDDEEGRYKHDDDFTLRKPNEGRVSPMAGKSRRQRRKYPDSWGMSAEKMRMKKRILGMYDGEQGREKDDMPWHNAFEAQMSRLDEQRSVIDLDVETLKRAEALHAASHEDQGPWQLEKLDEFDLEELMS